MSAPLIQDGVKISIDRSSGCSCQPSSQHIASVLRVASLTVCAYCGEVLRPIEVEMMCFCTASPIKKSPPSEWAGRVIEYERCLVLGTKDGQKFLHERCVGKALPFF